MRIATTANVINNTALLNPQIYILVYTLTDYPPIWDMVDGKMLKCRYKNCFVTKQRSFLEDIGKFDVLLFNIIDISYKNFTLPEERLEHQKYIFVSHEPPALHKVTSKYNRFFNLTWTYKLDSDISLRYMIIKNKRGTIIGPSKNMHWMDISDMKPISKKIKRKLQSKQKPAAWFASHCFTPSRREDYVKSLMNELNNYKLKIDIYGGCGDEQCPMDDEVCHTIIESDYYFYLAFENSLCEDYVTEKVLTATKHYTVPIVYGGADYKRFLPPGSYLDALELGQQKLARVINDTIHNKNKYYDFFKWHRYYTLHDPSETPETDEICGFCAFLNNDKRTQKTRVYEDFTAYWFP